LHPPGSAVLRLGVGGLGPSIREALGSGRLSWPGTGMRGRVAVFSLRGKWWLGVAMFSLRGDGGGHALPEGKAVAKGGRLLPEGTWRWPCRP